MNYQTLKSYTKNKLQWYTKQYYKTDTLRLNKLLQFSVENNDVRLAEVSQAYFWTLKDERAENFSKLTKEEFKSLDDFLNSDQKYVSEFNYKKQQLEEDKNKYRKLLKEMFDKYNLSLYRVSKELLQTNQSNVSRFFNKKENQTLSLKKLAKLYTTLYNWK